MKVFLGIFSSHWHYHTGYAIMAEENIRLRYGEEKNDVLNAAVQKTVLVLIK